MKRRSRTVSDAEHTMSNAQEAVFTAWWSWIQDAVACWVRMFEAQFQLLHAWAPRRASDGEVPGVTLRRRTPRLGPDLKDHYGRRAHDVDVDRI